MSREYVIVTEVEITKAGQVKNFQIKLPKNAKAVVAVDTDIRMKGGLLRKTEQAVKEFTNVSKEVIRVVADEQAVFKIQSTFLTWDSRKNEVMGRIKLQSMEKADIFFADWVHTNDLDGGLGDFLGDIYPISPYTLLEMPEAKKVDVSSETTVVNGIYRDYYGASSKQDTAYIVKVFLWIQLEVDCKMKGEKK